MSIDPSEIQLDAAQQQAIAQAAEALHKPWKSILDEGVQSVIRTLNTNGVDAPESALDVAERLGLVGCFEGPADLSTHPKHMEGFGEDATSIDLD